jgi:hypothetical protein
VTAWLPWWAASLVLGGVTVASWLAARRPLGVAGLRLHRALARRLR